MKNFDLRSPFCDLWRDSDPFAEVAKIEGEVFRTVKSRKTLRFEVDGKGFFLKHHLGVGWREIFKNLLQFKSPVLGADNEYRAICKLTEIGCATMTLAAFGERGDNPAQRESFIITEELTDTVSLEDFCRDWATNSPTSEVRCKIISALGHAVGLMHHAGINHRDCYLCHFLLKRSTLNSENPSLHVIDLHRAQLRKKVPNRYLIKDLAGLWFSAMDCGLTKNDLSLFLTAYHDEAVSDPKFQARVERVAKRLYRKIHHRTPPELG